MKHPGLQVGAEQALQIAENRQVQLRLITRQQSRLLEALQAGVALR